MVAVIDKRTTVVCLHAAGQIQPVDAPFETLAGLLEMPPFHIHCRSQVVPWMPGFGNDIRAEANAELMRRPLKQRRLGPGGEIGGRVPPLPRGPAPALPGAKATGRAASEFAEGPGAGLIRTNGKVSTSIFEWQAGLTDEQRRAIDLYTAPGTFEKVQAAARTGRPYLDSRAGGDVIRVLDDAFRHSTVEGDLKLFRMMRVSDEFGEALDAGSVMTHDGYVSCTATRGFATAFGEKTGRPMMMEILLPDGSRALPGEANVKEWILPRGTRFVVREKTKTSQGWYVVVEAVTR